MDEEEPKACPNCKRDIPSVNYLVHSMHCARNIKVCPVCKEPVPAPELQAHHETMHKMLPCKFCGDNVCGTDLEDHIRDSCGHTVRPCRFCELELPRRDLPAHEGYCGARTEQCAECGAWVMAKYRVIHRDSNHGFIKLDEEPDPTPRSMQEQSKPSNLRLAAPRARLTAPAPANNTSPNFPKTVIRQVTRPANEPYRNEATSSTDTVDAVSFTDISPSPTSINQPSTSISQPSISHFNQPWPVFEQPSSSSWVVSKVKRNNDQPQVNTNKCNKNKETTKSRGAVKKRSAPKPPRASPPPSVVADLVYQSARSTHGEGSGSQNPRRNDSMRLPDSTNQPDQPDQSSYTFPEPTLPRNEGPKNRAPRNLGHGRRSGGARNMQRRNDFKDLKPMSHQEFMERFQELQLQGDALEDSNSNATARAERPDRFQEIKSSLRELRRGLNEVTAPYNNSNNAPSSPLEEAAGVVLPCEFCGAAVPSDVLIDHQVVCRPSAMQSGPDEEEPLIPCEFCTEPLPLCRFTDHQERCQRETNLLFQEQVSFSE